MFLSGSGKFESLNTLVKVQLNYKHELRFGRQHNSSFSFEPRAVKRCPFANGIQFEIKASYFRPGVFTKEGGLGEMLAARLGIMIDTPQLSNYTWASLSQKSSFELNFRPLTGFADNYVRFYILDVLGRGPGNCLCVFF